MEPRDAFVHNVAAIRAIVEPALLDRLIIPYDRLLIPPPANIGRRTEDLSHPGARYARLRMFRYFRISRISAVVWIILQENAGAVAGNPIRFGLYHIPRIPSACGAATSRLTLSPTIHDSPGEPSRRERASRYIL